MTPAAEQRPETLHARAVIHRLEWGIAALVFLVPLLGLLTHRSIDPWLWRLSPKVALLTGLYAAGFVALLLSYRWSLPGWLRVIRSVTVVVAATIVGSAIVAEVVLRIVDPAPYRALGDRGRHAYDPDLGHVFTPDHEQVLQAREWRQTWRSNAQGVRADHDFGARPDTVTRILILGDSFTAGDQVSANETFPGVLQTLLDSADTPGRIEVVNAGVPGYGTYHASTYLRKFGPRFEPDVVVLAMTPNDWGENVQPLRVIARDGALIDADVTPGQLAQWRDQQRWYSLYGHFRRSRLRVAVARAARQFGGPTGYHHAPVFRDVWDDRSEEEYDLVEGHLSDIVATTNAMSADLAIILIPFREQLGTMDPGLDRAAPGRWLATFAADRDIPFLDLLETFRQHPTPQALYWAEDAHCTAEGYALVGRSLFRLLDESELAVPRR